MTIVCYSCGRGENPENTIEGVKHCLEVNPNWRIEMDIQLTSDEQLVLLHDDNTYRTTGKNNLISKINLNEIKALNAGYNFKKNGVFIYRSSPIQIPALREVFISFPESKLLLDVHSNNPKVVDHLINLIGKNFNSGDFIIASEYDNIIKSFKKKKPQWKYAVPAIEAKRMIYSSFFYLDGLFPITSDILMLPKQYGKISILRKRVIKHAKKRDKKIWAWMYEGEIVKTVNSINEVKILKAIGIDGVFTEFPRKLKTEIDTHI